MKYIPKNVWQKNLNEDDWKFDKVQNEEWLKCLAWELGREKTQADSCGNFPAPIQYAPTPKESKLHLFCGNPGEEIRKTLERLGSKPEGRLVKAEWPAYMSWRKKQHWRCFPQYEQEKWQWIALDWHTVHRYWGDEIVFAGTHLPFPPIMDGDGKTEILPFKIPWGWRDAEIKSAFAQWLKNNRPESKPEPPKKVKPVGAGSQPRQAQMLLKALAAWRLIQHYNGSHLDAYDHPGARKYLGKTYGNQGTWTKARKKVQAALKQVQQHWFAAENFASTEIG